MFLHFSRDGWNEEGRRLFFIGIYGTELVSTFSSGVLALSINLYFFLFFFATLMKSF